MLARPEKSEAAPYYFTYIEKAAGDDPVAEMHRQLPDALALFAGLTDKTSMHRYAPDKWTIRQVLNHITDTERAFTFRALWFARGFTAPLPGFDQNIGVNGADANHVPWLDHVEEFQIVRQSTIAFFKNLPDRAWSMTGVADGNPFTVRALAYIIPGHFAHHMAILNERYF